MTDAAPPRPRWLLATMVGYTVAGVLLLFPSGVMALMSPMVADAGINAGVWALIIGFALAPLLLVASVIVGWIGYGMRKPALAVASTATPALWLIYMMVANMVMEAAPRQ